MIKNSCVLFDMDGIIIDSEPLQMDAFNILMTELGCKIDKADTLNLVGRRALDNFTYLIGKYGIKGKPEDLVLWKDRIYSEILSKNLHSIPGIPELIEFLSSKKIPMGLVSGSSRAHVDFVLQGLGLMKYFGVTLASQDVLAGKPDPEGFLRAAAMLEADPRKSYVIEDTEPGVMAGVRGGFKVIAIPTEFTRLHDFSNAWKEVGTAGEALNLLDNAFLQ